VATVLVAGDGRQVFAEPDDGEEQPRRLGRESKRRE
jgi:hypothetical protein